MKPEIHNFGGGIDD